MMAMATPSQSLSSKRRSPSPWLPLLLQLRSGLTTPYEVSFRHCLFVPGVLHVIHNCTDDFVNSLGEWKAYIRQLRQVARLLHSKCERLQATVFSRDPATRAMAHRFVSFSPQVYEGRWAECLKAAQELLPLRADLVTAWDVRVYNFGAAADDRDDGGGR